MLALSSGWTFKTSLVMTSGIEDYCPFATTPMICVDWTDGKALPSIAMEWLVDVAVKYLNRGQVVDTGCMGGHGRTGTFLACLVGQVEGLSPKVAIQTIRSRHCKEAVESMAQVEQIYLFLGSTKEQANEDFISESSSKYYHKGNKGLVDDDFLAQYLDDYGYFGAY